MAEVTDTSAEALAAAVALLQAHPDYRVLRRLGSDPDSTASSEGAAAYGVIVDTETTGTNFETDQIIEVALLRFAYSPADGAIDGVAGVYEGLEDPGRPIPPEATAVNGITDAMVAGRRLNEAEIDALLAGVSLVVAHNAAFNRPFLERRLPLFSTLAWGCSYAHVPWAEEGFGGAKLDYLAAGSGFFYDAHRAQADCRAVLELLRRPLPRSGRNTLAVLLANALRPAYRLWALGSPFESKDILKQRGYYWDAQRRCWHRTVAADAAREEAVWLKTAVYGGRACRVEAQMLDAHTRFSRRSPRQSETWTP